MEEIHTLIFFLHAFVKSGHADCLRRANLQPAGKRQYRSMLVSIFKRVQFVWHQLAILDVQRGKPQLAKPWLEEAETRKSPLLDSSAGDGFLRRRDLRGPCIWPATGSRVHLSVGPLCLEFRRVVIIRRKMATSTCFAFIRQNTSRRV